MSRILITSGPTREYLDPVRFLTNGSSGRMGCALATVALAAGHEVVIVSGPVHVTYPRGAHVVSVVSTAEMLAACQLEFPKCDGLIAAAAPCDYRPTETRTSKIRKTGAELPVRLIETPDVVATLAETKRQDQWIIGFALETEDLHHRAMRKLAKKKCDFIVVNGPAAIDSLSSQADILAPDGRRLAAVTGTKEQLATEILALVAGPDHS